MTALIIDGIKPEREAVDWRYDPGLKAVAQACLEPIKHLRNIWAHSVEMARTIVHYDQPLDRHHAETLMRELCFNWLRENHADITFESEAEAIMKGTASAGGGKVMRATRLPTGSPGKRLKVRRG